MKVIGIKGRDRNEGIFILGALETAVRNHRVVLDDIALVTRDAHGKVKIEQTKDVTPGKGAGKGLLVGALVGLAAPPFLGATIVGGAIGAVWGKFRDRGINDHTMRSVGEMLKDGEAVVFALGSNEQIDALAAKVAEVMDGKMETFIVAEDDTETVHKAAAELPPPEDDSYLEATAMDFPMPERLTNPAAY